MNAVAPDALEVAIANQQSRLGVDGPRLERAVRNVLAEAGYTAGEISLAVVDDPTIHTLNARHLDHDYPTDVLSFCLADDPPRLDGEVIVSADTAITAAAECGWPAEHELLLYVLHGLLHLVGHRDKADDETRAMRAAEARHLGLLGVPAPPNGSFEASLDGPPQGPPQGPTEGPPAAAPNQGSRPR